MITTEQWRAAVGCFGFSRLCNSKYVKKTEFCVCNMFQCSVFVGTYEYVCNVFGSEWKY